MILNYLAKDAHKISELEFTLGLYIIHSYFLLFQI